MWVTMLAMSDRDGMVNASVPGLADRAKVSVEECVRAIGVFSSPDQWSRSKEHGGRRIREVEGGWELLNHAKYRDKMSPEEVREKARERQARWRERQERQDRAGRKLKKEGPSAKEMAYVAAVERGDEVEADRLAAPEGRGGAGGGGAAMSQPGE